jgi:hypothetical protein
MGTCGYISFIWNKATETFLKRENAQYIHVLLPFVRFQVLTAASMIRTFWDIPSYSLVGVYRRFRAVYCLHYHPNDRGSMHL